MFPYPCLPGFVRGILCNVRKPRQSFIADQTVEVATLEHSAQEFGHSDLYLDVPLEKAEVWVYYRWLHGVGGANVNVSPCKREKAPVASMDSIGAPI